MDEPTIDSGGEPGVRKKLSPVGVTGDLQGDAGFFSYGGTIRGVGDQDTGAGSVDLHSGEDGAHVLGVRGIAIGHAEKLQAIKVDILLVEIADAGF